MYIADTPEGKREPIKTGERAKCPECGGDVIGVCGREVVWHWRHASNQDCDSWHKPMSQWHRDWQARFPVEQREVVIVRDGVKHRADVQLPDGTVIEFQHSPLSTAEAIERAQFYGQMIWVVHGDNQAWLRPGSSREHRYLSAFVTKNWLHDTVCKAIGIDRALAFYSVKGHIFKDDGDTVESGFSMNGISIHGSICTSSFAKALASSGVSAAMSALWKSCRNITAGRMSIGCQVLIASAKDVATKLFEALLMAEVAYAWAANRVHEKHTEASDIAQGMFCEAHQIDRHGIIGALPVGQTPPLAVTQQSYKLLVPMRLRAVIASGTGFNQFNRIRRAVKEYMVWGEERDPFGRRDFLDVESLLAIQDYKVAIQSTTSERPNL